MRRSLIGLTLAIGAAACGRLQVDAIPDRAALEPAGSDEPIAAPLPPPVVATVQRTPVDTVTAIRIVRDSAADAAALAALTAATPPSLPDVPIESQPTWDLNVADFADQPRVQYWVDYFSDRVHDRFQIWLDRMPRYETYIREQLSQQGLPSDLVYLALIESGFSSSAVSSARAVGMWQFMPATGKGYGLRVDIWLDERRDPIKATDAAARHLRSLTDRFGSHYLAAAAYNAGAGKVGRSLTRMNDADPGDEDDDEEAPTGDEMFFSLADTRLLVQETKDYVPKLIAAALIAKEPSKHGFKAQHDVREFPHDSVLVDGGTGLDLMARLAGVTLDEMRELNPQLLRLVTPPDRVYPVRVPAGLADDIAAEYARLPSTERHAIVSHTVKKGETVASVAARYDVAAATLRSANRAARGKSLKPGTVLYVPVSSEIPLALLREPDPVVTTTARTRVATHLVKRGETLSGIAARYHVSVAALRSANHLSARATVKAGQRLTIRTATARRTVTRRSVAASSKRATKPTSGARSKASTSRTAKSKAATTRVAARTATAKRPG